MTSQKGVDTRSVPRGTELRLERALRGVQTVLPAGTTLEIGTVSYGNADLATTLTQGLTVYETPRSLHAQLEAAVKARIAVDPVWRTFLAGLKAALGNKLGRTNPLLVQFGFAPYKARKKATAAQTVVSQAKSKATREARGTLGSAQKAAIHGEVSQVVVGSNGKAQAVLLPASTPAAPVPGSSTKTS
jgi:hypothetical protein